MYLRKCSTDGDRVILSRSELENWREVCRQRGVSSTRWQGRFDVLDELLNSL